MDEIEKLKLLLKAANNILVLARASIDLCQEPECECDQKPVSDWLKQYKTLLRD